MRVGASSSGHVERYIAIAGSLSASVGTHMPVHPRDCGVVAQRDSERAADAVAAEVVVDAELVEQHLGALVGMSDLDTAHESHRLLVDVGDAQVVVALVEELLGPVALDVVVEQVTGGLDRGRVA